MLEEEPQQSSSAPLLLEILEDSGMVGKSVIIENIFCKDYTQALRRVEVNGEPEGTDCLKGVVLMG